MKKQTRLYFLIISIASLLLFMPSAILAYCCHKEKPACERAAPCPVKCLHDGAYLGAAIGYDSYRERINASNTFNGASIASNPDISSTGVVGGLLAGYGEYIDNYYYVGAEIFGNISEANQSAAISDSLLNSYNVSIATHASYGLALLPGIKINDSALVYARVGYIWANFTSSENHTVAGSSLTTNTNRTLGGYNFGLGIETAIYRQLSLRGDFIHTNYNSMKSSLSTNFTPWDNQLMLSLLFHFA